MKKVKYVMSDARRMAVLGKILPILSRTLGEEDLPWDVAWRQNFSIDGIETQLYRRRNFYDEIPKAMRDTLKMLESQSPLPCAFPLILEGYSAARGIEKLSSEIIHNWHCGDLSGLPPRDLDDAIHAVNHFLLQDSPPPCDPVPRALHRALHILYALREELGNTPQTAHAWTTLNRCAEQIEEFALISSLRVDSNCPAYILKRAIEYLGEAGLTDPDPQAIRRALHPPPPPPQDILSLRESAPRAASVCRMPRPLDDEPVIYPFNRR